LIFGCCACLAVNGLARDKHKERRITTIGSYAPGDGEFTQRREGNVVIWEPRQEREADIRVEPARPTTSPANYEVRSFPSVPSESPVERSSERNRTLGARLRSIFSKNETRHQASQPIPVPEQVTVEINGNHYTSRLTPASRLPSNVKRYSGRQNDEESRTTRYASENAQERRRDEPASETQIDKEADSTQTAASQDDRNASGEIGRRSLEKRQEEELQQDEDLVMHQDGKSQDIKDREKNADTKLLAPLPDNVAAAQSKSSETPEKKAPAKPAPERPVALPTDTPGVVKSPYPPHHQLDVRGLASGTLAKDPSTGEIFKLP
jgi:hypothetical protein